MVDSTYKCKSGALNKARALQFCLEEDKNFLNDEDWIVHLDEETLLTEASVKGILNFITAGKHSFGQGVITYANNPPQFNSFVKYLQNRICTVADSIRVADDFGKLRFQLTYLNKPIFGWKGSYVVCNVSIFEKEQIEKYYQVLVVVHQLYFWLKIHISISFFQAGAERKISFDWGLAGSKAEDCFFGMVALDRGYTFDFIEGEMNEKSPFTFTDFIKQRKRWIQGFYLVCTSDQIPIRSKFLLTMSLGKPWFLIVNRKKLSYKACNKL